MTFSANEEREILVRVDLSPREPWQVGRPARIAELPIRPIFQGEVKSGKAWTLRRVVRSPISTDIPDVMFGESNRAGEPPVSRTVRVQVHVPGTLRVSVSTPMVAATLSLQSDSSSAWLLTVTPRTDVPPGPFRGTIKLETIPTEGQPAHRLELPVEGLLLGNTP